MKRKSPVGAIDVPEMTTTTDPGGSVVTDYPASDTWSMVVGAAVRPT